MVFIENRVIEFIYFHCLFPCHAGYHLCSILFSCEHTSVIFFSFPVYTSLQYKNAVKAWYEIKLQEARVEAQQDAQYLLQGDICFNCMKQSFREFLHVSFLFANYWCFKLNFLHFSFFRNLDHHNRCYTWFQPSRTAHHSFCFILSVRALNYMYNHLCMTAI